MVISILDLCKEIKMNTMQSRLLEYASLHNPNVPPKV
jgi:hypothetical protein